MDIYLDDFRWVQGGLTDTLMAILKSFRPNNGMEPGSLPSLSTPPTDKFIISGVEVTSPAAGMYSWTEGYVYISGKVYWLPASTAPILSGTPTVPPIALNLYIVPDTDYNVPTTVEPAAVREMFTTSSLVQVYKIRRAKVEGIVIANASKLSLRQADRLSLTGGRHARIYAPSAATGFTGDADFGLFVAPSGEAYFRGVINTAVPGANIASGSTIITGIPTQQRPSVRKRFIAPNATGDDFCTVSVETNGTVTVAFSPTPQPLQVNLSQVRWWPNT